MDWLTTYKIPVGQVASNLFNWLRLNMAGFFDAIGNAAGELIAGFQWLLQAPPPLVIIAIFVAITWWLQRKWTTCLLVLVGFLFILNQGYWEETTQSLTLVIVSCVVCMVIGVPVGI